MRPSLKLYQHSDRVFTPSSSIENFLIQQGIEANKLTRWPRGVDINHFNPNKHNASFPRQYNLKYAKTILFISRLVKVKETDTLIRFYKLIENRFNLVIVGDGPDRKRMEAKMPKATFTGHLNGETLAQAYASCDLFIFPSTTETFGNVVLEAMASGLPVIAADEGGPCDIVQNDQTGYLVEPRNEQAFFEKTQDILSEEEADPGVRVVLGHFCFVYIHPYMDGNGRIGRFLMNLMLAAGGYPWTIVPVDIRGDYMNALEQASVGQNIIPLTKLLGELVSKKSK